MANAPDLIAYVVKDAPEGSDRKASWREIGAAWRNKNGDGFTLMIHDQLSVAGRIVCMPRREQAERPDEQPRAQRGTGPGGRR